MRVGRSRRFVVGLLFGAVVVGTAFFTWRRWFVPLAGTAARTSVDSIVQAPARWLGRKLTVEGYFDAGSVERSRLGCSFALREAWASLRVRAFPCFGLSNVGHQRLVEAYGELRAEGDGYVLDAAAVVGSGEIDSVRYFPPDTTGVTVADIEAAAQPFRATLAARLASPDVASPRDVKELVRGFFHGCALRFDGTVSCWHNHQNEGELSGKPSPPFEIRGVPALAAFRLAIQLGCGLDAGGDLYCWEAPRSTRSDFHAPLETRRIEIPPARSVELIASGGRAVLRDGRVAYFGERLTVERVVDGDVPRLAYTAGGCAVGDEAVRCGPDEVFSRDEVDSVSDAFSLYSHACLLGRGDVRCRGSNWFSELGVTHDAHPDRDIDRWVTLPLRERAVQVAVGGRHTCVQLESGAVECLGGNEHGQASPFSPRMSSASLLPVARFPPGYRLSAGEDLSCMTSATGRHECWGNCKELPELPKTTCTSWPPPRPARSR
jgi:hypothetical protein